MPEKRAVVLINFFPGTDRVYIRPGYAVHATGLGASIETLMEYVPQSGTRRLFAAAGASIFDATSAGAIGAAAQTGLTNSRWQHINFGTPGGQFLLAVNGADAPRNFNGTTWATTPAITGPTTSNLVWINAHQRRLWFGERDSLTAWYLPVNSIGGAASSFSFAGLTKNGGYIVAMGTWSRDGGDGQDDVAAWITSEGECLVYQGTDPASTATWTLVGVFQLGKPIGRRCFIKAGADLLVVTESGVVTLADILSIDRSQTERVALTAQVNRLFNDYVRAHGSRFGWQPVIYPRGTMLLFNIPTGTATADQIAFNTITKAPCQFQNIPAVSWSGLGDDIYFGSANGTVYRFDNDATSDAGTNIETSALQAFSYFGLTGQTKVFHMVNPIIEANTSPSIAVQMNFDGDRTPPPFVPTTIAGTAGTWDSPSSLWDDATFGGDADTYREWIGVWGRGVSAAIYIRTASTTLRAGWSATQFTFVPGSQI